VLFLVLCIICCELFPSIVVVAFDVEGDREMIEHIFALSIVEGFHVVIECFFIA